MGRINNPWSQGLLSLSLGLSLTLSFAPFNYPITFLSLCAFLVLLLRTSMPLRISFLFGLGWFGAGISWVHVSIAQFGGVPLIVSILMMLVLVGYLALFVMGFGKFVHWIQYRFGLLAFIATAPIAWSAMEYFRSVILTGFPWLSLGYSQLHTPFAYLAPVIGETGLTTVMLMLSSCVAVIIHSRIQSMLHQTVSQPSVTRFAYGGIVAILVLGSSAVMYFKPIDTGAQPKTFSVGLVQGNIEQSMRWLPELDRPIMDKYLNMSQGLWHNDLVIWPEAAIPKLESEAQLFLYQLDQQAFYTNTGLITGIVNYDMGKNEILNQLISLGKKDNNLKQPQYYYNHNNRFAKHHLLPIGEFIPFENWLRGLAPIFDLPMSSFTRGQYVQDNLVANSINLLPAICFEIVFPRQIHANITPDTHVIITVSNDAWFGDSHGPHQHMQIAQMRALEFGLPVLRVTNNGITGIIDHRGRIQSHLPQFESGMLIDEVTINTNNTLYRRFGDIINVIICFFWMAIYIGLSMVTRNI